MAPTLMGEHYEGACGRCGRHAVAVDASVKDALPAVVPCFLCGEPLNLDAQTVHLGDMVTVQPLTPGQSIVVGQLVAIHPVDGSSLRVKRVAAVGGQTVDHDAGQLTVDGQRIEDSLFAVDPRRLPRMTVSDESSTTAAVLKSRWSPIHGDHSAWRCENGSWSLDHTMKSDWLVYAHVNVHEDGVAAPVRDDYEYNASLLRRLNEVDRLQVTANITANEACRIEVAYWMPGGVLLDIQSMTESSKNEAVGRGALPRFHFVCPLPGLRSRPLPQAGEVTRDQSLRNIHLRTARPQPGERGVSVRSVKSRGVHDTAAPQFRTEFYSTTHSAIHSDRETRRATGAAPVTRESPVAIRVVAQKETGNTGDDFIRLENLRLWKSVTYRLRRNDDRSRYPITLGEGEYFVVGDNVPVSIDSRDHGPIRRDRIVGLIRSPE